MATAPPRTGRAAPSPADVLLTAGLGERIQATLARFLATQLPRLQAVAPELAPVAATASTFLLDGGKRLRPAFCYWGYRGAGGPDSDEVVRAAAALELLHACALIHDDVMDGSDTRRGMPAVHRRFQSMHEDAEWLGSGADFGRSIAIVIGNLCLIWADELLAESGLRPEALLRARPVYDQMRVELMGGQYLDLLESARGNASVAAALRVARFKTAVYTIEKPLHLGAALGGAPPSLFAAYSAYGVPLGEAFQLRDDLLGVFGDPGETGKPAGDDLREGKRTVLVALALERARGSAGAELRARLGDPALDFAGIERLREILVECGAVTAVESMISDRVDAAREALEAVPLPPDAGAVLRRLTDAATARRL